MRVAIQCCTGSKTTIQCEKNSSFVAAELKIPCVEGRKERRKRRRRGRNLYIYTRAGPNQCIYYIHYTCTYNVRRRRGRTIR